MLVPAKKEKKMAENDDWVGNHPCPARKKRPVLVTRDLTKTFIFTPENPHSSSLVWNMVSSDCLVFGIFQVPPGGTYGPPTDVHIGDDATMC